MTLRTFAMALLALVLCGSASGSFGQSQQAQPPDPTGQAPTSPAPTTPPTFPPNKGQSPEGQSPNAKDSASSSSSSTSAQEDSDSFTGTIVNQSHNYVLRNGDHDYKLDDQAQATKFKGRKVKVTGSLDKQSNTIHVDKIEEAPES
jgi:hypothetical protein